MPSLFILESSFLLLNLLCAPKLRYTQKALISRPAFLLQLLHPIQNLPANMPQHFNRPGKEALKEATNLPSRRSEPYTEKEAYEKFNFKVTFPQ